MLDLDATVKIYEVKPDYLSLWHSSKAYREAKLEQCVTDALENGHAQWVLLCDDIQLATQDGPSHE